MSHECACLFCRCYPSKFGARLLDMWLNSEMVAQTALRTLL